MHSVDISQQIQLSLKVIDDFGLEFLERKLPFNKECCKIDAVVYYQLFYVLPSTCYSKGELKCSQNV